MLVMSFCVCGAQITQAYSKIGLIRDLSLTVIGHLRSLRCRKPFILLALLVTSQMCCDHNSLESIFTPKYFECITSRIYSFIV